MDWDCCENCWMFKHECTCLDMAEYDRLAKEAQDAAVRLEEWAKARDLNVRAKYIQKAIHDHRESILWMHDNRED